MVILGNLRLRAVSYCLCAVMMPRPTIYYNDNCPQVCAWVRQLMFDGLIPYGVVDSRSILDVQPAA